MNQLKPLRIFVDCHVFDGGFQGTTTYLKGLYTELINDENRIYYLAAHNVIKLKNIFGEHPNVIFVPYKSHNKFYRLLIEIPRLIIQHKIDFAHFQYIVPPIKLCKYIVTTHDVLFIDFPEYFPVFNRIKNTFLYKWGVRAADVLLTVSEYSALCIKKHFSADTCYITPNGVDEAFFEEYDKAQLQSEVNKKYGVSSYIIYISRWEPRKNHLLVLKSFVDMGLYKTKSIVFVGDKTLQYPEFDNYFKTLDDSIKQKIFCFDKVDFDTMLLMLRAADASVYPSKAEGFGIPPLESLAAGIPTITSNATAMGDFTFLKDYSFDPLNHKQFKDKLHKALTAPVTDVKELQDKVRHQYSWKNSAKAYNIALAAFVAKDNY